jgi:hypothetical protein
MRGSLLTNQNYCSIINPRHGQAAHLPVFPFKGCLPVLSSSLLLPSPNVRFIGRAPGVRKQPRPQVG